MSCEQYGVSETELKIIKAQAERRAAMRAEYLKNTSHPWKHAAEAGYHFDPALQRFISMKATHFEFFQPNKRNTLFGIFGVVLPIAAFTYVVYNERAERERKLRAGEIKYRDRLFKLQ